MTEQELSPEQVAQLDRLLAALDQLELLADALERAIDALFAAALEGADD